MLEMKIGNTFTFEVAIRDIDGNLNSTLATASAIRCMVKTAKDDADVSALISKTVGAGITADSPDTGYLSITFDGSDSTALSSGEKYISIQVEYATGVIEEIDIIYNNQKTDIIKLNSDVIRG